MNILGGMILWLILLSSLILVPAIGVYLLFSIVKLPYTLFKRSIPNRVQSVVGLAVFIPIYGLDYYTTKFFGFELNCFGFFFLIFPMCISLFLAYWAAFPGDVVSNYPETSLGRL